MRTQPAPTLPSDAKELEQILQRAREGDESALPIVRQLAQWPEAVEDMGGNLARQAEYALISAAVAKNLCWREALCRKLEMLRAELGGPTPTPLERLLAERVAACWLQLHYVEMVLAQGMGKMSMVEADYHQRTRDRAHKRYLSAIKVLAMVRKLAAPVLQVNIAKKQVNVAGPAPPS